MELPNLPERPKADVLTVEAILKQARAGRLRVPHFQTGLRWKSSHVVALFDSIMRGFPIGNLLLWKQPADADSLTFGPVQVAASAVPDALQIVDGQQRVTALVAALLHPDSPPLGGVHAVWVDLRTGAFQVHRSQPESHWLPLNVLGDRVRLLQWSRGFQAGESTESLVTRAFEVHTTISTYELPVYIVSNATSDVLKLIFSRVNNAGVSLDESQVFEALFGGSKDQHPLREMSSALNSETGFGELPHDWLLRCVKAVAELHPRLAFDEKRAPSADLIARTQEALRRAILLLMQDGGLPHSAVLPYRSPLIVLARFFDRHPAPEQRNRELLVRWIWRGALSGRHTDSSHGTVAAQLADIGDDASASVQRLLARVPRLVDVPEPTHPWNGHAAATRLYAAVLLQDYGIDDAGVLDCVLNVLSKKELGEVFRPALPELGGSIAARVFRPAARPPFRSLDPESLARLGLDQVSVEALLAGRASSFLDARTHHLRARMGLAIRRYATVDASDRPPIAAIVAAANA